MRPITRTEFVRFQRFIFDHAGITLADSKQALVTGRLGKRLNHHHIDSYGEYCDLLQGGSATIRFCIRSSRLAS